jgi:cytochrome oxidase assembly protein ShyY1
MNWRDWWRTALTPKWLGALLSFMILAGVFGGLSQWQIGRAVEEATIETVDSETPVPIDQVATPGGSIRLVDGGRKVTIQAVFGSDQFVVGNRKQGDLKGEWLVARAITGAGACIPVAVGFAEHIDLPAAPPDEYFDSIAYYELTGRFVPTEDPSNNDADGEAITVISIARLVNDWDCKSIYEGYLVLDEAPADSGLETIETMKPLPQATLNWLNIFYAAEWIFFAGFTLYFWYRLVRDAVEREAENSQSAQT